MGVKMTLSDSAGYYLQITSSGYTEVLTYDPFNYIKKAKHMVSVRSFFFSKAWAFWQMN